MASGCIVVYEGKRGRVFRMKFSDTGGRQRMETLGPERTKDRPGLTRRQAEKLLRDRLSDVESKRWRPVAPLTFEEYARSWLEQGETRRSWKYRTIVAYTTVVGRLCDSLGPMRLADLRPREVAGYVARKTSEGFAPATVNRDLSILHDILKCAVRDELIDSNPAADAERPRVRQKRWRILRPAEVALVARSFADEQARCVFLMLVICGLRRHELQ